MAQRLAVARRRIAEMPRSSQGTMRFWWWIVSLVLLPAPVVAQGESPCAFLCTPELRIEPTWSIENFGARPTVEIDGLVERAARETVFELIFSLDVPTTIPRLGLTLEAIFVPFGGTSVHPFTDTPAAAAGRNEIRDNGIEIETELNFELFGTEQTGGWVSSHVDIVDQFSPGKTPQAGSVYTHKLDLEWDTAFHLFNRLTQGHWLRNVETEVSLDYRQRVCPGLATPSEANSF